ncbi:hypothetical protein [Phytoactinopolyspora halotolerans]|uniref:HAD family hydrolase n=1 Tax=Phytoactinopolyspora halotolerans TaxID=1981512 RepID=A0A6L9S4Q4_9ACTN|nr:hypothetical protein [Phytoactinopolyspora halotolerans]NED99613.1 hypothetical protein [Phytoactinopolyspora halotolerans]
MRRRAAFRGALSLDELAGLLGAGSVRPDVLSVDVFDTVLTRACGEPFDLFHWLGRRLRQRGVLTVDAEVFARARVAAERAVWRRDGGLDSHAGLGEFYEETVHRLGMDPSLVTSMVEAELELEAEISRPVPAAKWLLKLCVEQKQKIVFTSDTYFPRAFIESRLQTAGVFSSNARCLLSSELAESKASGRLFTRMLTDGQPASGVLHVGDHPHSDVAMPIKTGMHARWIPDGRLNRYEKSLATSSYGTAGLGSAFAGASRLARLSTDAGNPHERAIRDVAAGVAAPALVGYVLWILLRAQRLSLRRVVFLARDGQVILDIARRLVKALDLPIELTYLYVSRRSTNLAATFGATEEETGWVFRDLSVLSPDEVLDRFDLQWDDVRHLLSVDRTVTRPVSGAAVGEAMREHLKYDGPVRQMVLDRAAARRELVLDYLKQDGLLDGEPYGIVDFGGVGSQVRAVHALVSAAGAAPPRIFMMGLDRPEDAGLVTPDDEPAWVRDTECYLYDHRRGRGIRRARGFGTCVQMFCAADHGTVVGYGRENGRVIPELATPSDDATMSWGLLTMRAAIANFVDNLVLNEDLVDPYADVRDASCDVLEMFWTSPSAGEAGAWGSFPFEGAQASGSAPRPLAYRYTWRTVGSEIASGRFPNLGWQHWYEGSLALSSPLVRSAVERAETMYRRFEHTDKPGVSALIGTVRRLAGR